MKNYNTNNALQKHKVSDRIKWFVVFLLVFLLIASMVAVCVTVFSPAEAEEVEEIEDSVTAFSVSSFNLQDLQFYYSMDGTEEMDVSFYNSSVGCSLTSVEDLFSNAIFENDKVYFRISANWDNNARIVYKTSDGKYIAFGVSIDSVEYDSNVESVIEEDGKKFVNKSRCLKINYFYDPSGDGDGDVRYDSLLLMQIFETDKGSGYEDYVGLYLIDDYSRPSTCTSYELVGFSYYDTGFQSSVDCIVYND